MGRDASKSTGNVWREARLTASKYNDALCSQDNVADIIGVSRDTIRRVETSANKVMPVDVAVLLADLYNAPELLNHYCLHECPIGSRRWLSENAFEIDRATVRLTKILRKETVQWIKHGLQDIAADGEISEDEFPAFDEIMEELKELAKIISELEIVREKSRKKQCV